MIEPPAAIPPRRNKDFERYTMQQLMDALQTPEVLAEIRTRRAEWLGLAPLVLG